MGARIEGQGGGKEGANKRPARAEDKGSVIEDSSQSSILHPPSSILALRSPLEAGKWACQQHVEIGVAAQGHLRPGADQRGDPRARQAAPQRRQRRRHQLQFVLMIWLDILYSLDHSLHAAGEKAGTACEEI